MNKFKIGDEVIVLCQGGIIEPICSGEIFTYFADFVSGAPAGYIKNERLFTAALWSSLQLKSEYDMENNQSKTEVTRIPFDLERAKKGDKVINGAGHPVRILTFDRVIHGGLYPIVALHMDCEHEMLFCHRLNGESVNDHVIYKELLFMAPVEKRGWITIVRHCLGSATMCTNIRDTRDDAILEAKERYMNHDIICTKQITWEE